MQAEKLRLCLACELETHANAHSGSLHPERSRYCRPTLRLLICKRSRSPRGGMVDTGDLKSLGRIGRAGSSPAAGTT